jgi:ABC-2 type transport system ATP-binding protein
MIEAHELSRRYGDFTAVEDISFTVQEGEIVGMLGPNGAGKTTTIRMVTGFLPPTTGTVTVAGKDLFTEPRQARREVGYLPENVSLYDEMRVEEYLAYRARLEGMSRAEERRAIPEVLESAMLEEVRHQIIGTLSKGFKQRVGLATAILHQPRVLVLDEPTVGLDPKQIIAIRELIRELGHQRTLLISTHILPEVELLCDRVVIIDRGHIVAEGTPRELRQQWIGNAVVRVGFKGEPVGVPEALGHLDGVVAVRREGGGRWAVECEPESDPREDLFRLAVDKGWVLLHLSEQQASLEDVFVRLTTRDTVGEGSDGTGGPVEGEEEAEETSAETRAAVAGEIDDAEADTGDAPAGDSAAEAAPEDAGASEEVRS